MAITWKQIDTDGSGYVNGNEAVVAKAQGVKNVWNHMTQSDYEKGITVDQKYIIIKDEVEKIVGRYRFCIDVDAILLANLDMSNVNAQNQLFGTYRELEQLRNELEKMQKDFDNEFSDLEGAWYTLKYGTEDLINKFGNLIKFDQDERVHKYYSYKTRIDCLKHDIGCMEYKLCMCFKC